MLRPPAECCPCHFGLVCCSPRMCFSYRDAGMSFGSCESQPISSSHGALASAVLTSFWAAYAESPSHPHAGGPTLSFISLVAAAVRRGRRVHLDLWPAVSGWVLPYPSTILCRLHGLWSCVCCSSSHSQSRCVASATSPPLCLGVFRTVSLCTASSCISYYT